KSKNNSDVTFTPTAGLGISSTYLGSNAGARSISAKAGVTARFKYGSLSAEYLSQPGPVRRDYVDEEKVKNGQEIRLGSSWHKDFFDKRLSLDGSATVSYLLRSQQVKAEMAAGVSYKGENGWSFGADVKVDPTKVASGEGAASVSLNARKVIEAPQPRLRYYNLKVVFFKDENGNRLNEPTEAGVSNVLVSLQRSKEPSPTGEPIQFKPPEIMSDEKGLVSYLKAPQGTYFISLKELFAQTQYTNMNGSELEVLLNKHTTLLVPYTKSVMITGNVSIARDKFSRLTGISPARIRVTVTDANGAVSHSLTDDKGNFIISAPFTEKYTVTLKNVLGDKFDLPDGTQEIQVTNGEQRFEVNFHFKEKGRSINFGG
ncbi:MAG: hypothetical protein EAZ89_05410, partial [Bacteroidetes bacterium]